MVGMGHRAIGHNVKCLIFQTINFLILLTMFKCT